MAGSTNPNNTVSDPHQKSKREQMWSRRAVAAAAIASRALRSQRDARLLSSASSSGNDPVQLLRLLEKVAAGKVSPAAAAAQCQTLEYEDIGGYAKIDTHRFARTGFPEVVYAEGKTSDQVAQILEIMVRKGVDANVMASRVAPERVDAIRSKMAPELEFFYYPTARILASRDLAKAEKNDGNQQKKEGVASVLCAGTSDLPVAEEAAITLELAGYEVTRLYDVGVAGIHRLLRNLHVLHESDVAICVAGMDGALPGVVVWSRVQRPRAAADDAERVLAGRRGREHRQRLRRCRPRRCVGINYVQHASTPMNPTSSSMASATGATTPTLPSRMTASADLSPDAAATGASATTSAPITSLTHDELSNPPFSFEMHKTAIPGLDAVEPPQIESECTADVSMPEAPAAAEMEADMVVLDAELEKEEEKAVVAVERVLLFQEQEQLQDGMEGEGVADVSMSEASTTDLHTELAEGELVAVDTHETEPEEEQEAVAVVVEKKALFQQEREQQDAGVIDLSHNHSSDAATSPSAADTDNETTLLPASSTAPSSPLKSRSPSPLPHARMHQQQRQSPPQALPRTTTTQAEEAASASQRRSPQERMITVSATELERWQQRVVAHIENHFSNEQFKRIAEFGRAHANLLVEAKEYVYNIETQLTAQFEKERADIRAQAEAYVAQVKLENQQLRRTVDELQHQIVMLRLPSRHNRNRIIVADDKNESEEEDGDADGNEVEVQADVAVEETEEMSSDSGSSSCGSPDVQVVGVKVKRKSKQLRHDDRDEEQEERRERRKKGAKLLLLHDANKDSRGDSETACEISVSSMVVDKAG